MMFKFINKNLLISLFVCLTVAACASSKQQVSMKVHSDPLGAYVLMQVKYKDKQDTDWIFLGATPVIVNKSIVTSSATEVLIKVIRPGFFDQVKTWKAKEFLKEHRKNKQIIWIPRLVKQ